MWGPTLPPPRFMLARGASAGIAIELFGIAVALFGLAAGNLYFSGAGPAYQPNPVIAGIGALIALIGLIVHFAKA